MATADPDWTIDLAAPIEPQVHRILRERIIRNDLRPDQRISEAEIASFYGVSRQPVREAFIRLAAEGLVAVLPQRGTMVRRIGLSGVLDARFLREAFEADIVRLLAREPARVDLAGLRGHIARQRRAAERDALGFMRSDQDFHRALAAAAGKDGIWPQVEGLTAHMDRVRFLSIGALKTRRLVDQHARIVELIAAGDETGAEAAVREHLRELLKDLPQIIGTHPDFFDAPLDGAEDRVVVIKSSGSVTPSE